jgi:hypothetical protein
MTIAAVRKLALALPGVETGTSYGTEAFKVRGKLFARLKEDGETLVVRTTPADRDVLVNVEPGTFFFTDHYRDHPWVLVRLGAVKPATMGALLEDAWRLVAPRPRRPNRRVAKPPSR